MKSTKRQINKVGTVHSAWDAQAAEVKFAGMSLEDFETLIKPMQDTQAKIAQLEEELSAARLALVNHSMDSYKGALRVASAVKADPAYGDNSPLYQNMGYVAAIARKSGLTRKAQAAAAAAAANAETLKS